MKILIIICAFFFSIDSQLDCTPAKCPDDLKGNPRGGQLPCYLSVRDTKDHKTTGVCKHCHGEIVQVNNTWIHDTFTIHKAGYIRCADHLAKYVCESPTIKTVAAP